MPHETAPTLDEEVNVLAACYHELVKLDKDAQGRALRYLAQRLGVPLIVAAPQPLHVEPIDLTPRITG